MSLLFALIHCRKEEILVLTSDFFLLPHSKKRLDFSSKFIAHTTLTIWKNVGVYN
jgi:hypothetical protein